MIFIRKILPAAAILMLFSIFSNGQSTWQKVYTLMQTNCALTSCHSNGSAIASLDLEGSGASAMSDVYNSLIGVIPTNSFAAGKGYKRIYTGDPHRSFLFRKVNQSLDSDLTLELNEAGSMTPTSGLLDHEIELIRQWIVDGAPQSGDVVDTALINDYYAGNGVDAITGIIAPMDPADGYQIHLGPFFLPPSSEIEYYSRYDLDLPNAFEINRFELNLGPTYSHHFILFKYQDGYENVTSNGFRLDAAHTYNEMVAVVQSSDTINLPNKTAFFWPQTTVLDLNTHMINYSTTKVLKAEVYINIYTQTTGIAKQIMYTDLVANTSISIPNDGNTHTFDKPVYTAGDFDEFFVWQLSSHTHKYGTDYDIYKRNGDGSKGGKLFDASHLGGDPNLAFIGYDYQEPPVLEFYPFFPIVPDAGFIHEASFVNTGPVPVAWGATSADEMMVMLYMYVEDTAGLTSGIKNIDIDKEEAVLVYPNPASDHVLFQVTHFRQGQFLILYDLLGREVIMRRFDSNTILLETGKLEDGIYIYKILSEDSFVDSGKLVIHRN